MRARWRWHQKAQSNGKSAFRCPPEDLLVTGSHVRMEKQVAQHVPRAAAKAAAPPRTSCDSLALWSSEPSYWFSRNWWSSWPKKPMAKNAEAVREGAGVGVGWGGGGRGCGRGTTHGAYIHTWPARTGTSTEARGEGLWGATGWLSRHAGRTGKARGRMAPERGATPRTHGPRAPSAPRRGARFRRSRGRAQHSSCAPRLHRPVTLTA